MTEIQQILFDNSDEKYREFQARLMPNVDKENIIGVRTPVLRKIAKELSKKEDIYEFLDTLPHKYYDENNLHGFILSELKNYEEVIKRLDEFLPYVDNWATCDLLSPKIFKKNTDRLFDDAEHWLISDKTFTVRFGIEMLMSYYHDERSLKRVAKIKSEEYYVNMMLAWFFATELAKQWDNAIVYITQKKLSPWVHNKTIQKAIESYRITNEQKEFLRSLKI